MLDTHNYVKEYKDHAEGILTDVTDSGINVLIFFNRPTEEEMNQIKANNPLKIKLLDKNGIIFFFYKFGSLNWMDSPYSVHLSKKLTNLEDVADGLGYAVTIQLIDTSNGAVVHNRLFGLSTDLSKKLKKMIEEQREKPFDKMEYQMNLMNIYNAYSTKELIKFAQ